MPPRELAAALAEELGRQPGIKSVEIAGPGFLNIRLDAAAAGRAGPRRWSQAGAEYGHTDRLAGQRINLEFVSANPTGPVHIGGVRWAAVGDALSPAAAGGRRRGRHRVLLQRRRLADRPVRPLAAAPPRKGEPTPEDGYGGAYIAEIASAVRRRARPRC